MWRAYCYVRMVAMPSLLLRVYFKLYEIVVERIWKIILFIYFRSPNSATFQYKRLDLSMKFEPKRL